MSGALKYWVRKVVAFTVLTLVMSFFVYAVGGVAAMLTCFVLLVAAWLIKWAVGVLSE